MAKEISEQNLRVGSQLAGPSPRRKGQHTTLFYRGRLDGLGLYNPFISNVIFAQPEGFQIRLYGEVQLSYPGLQILNALLYLLDDSGLTL